MIYEILKKHKHVMEYDEETDIIKKSDIVHLLRQAWDITPSKNNIMAWQVFVIGPDNQNYKNAVYDICSENEDRSNRKNKNADVDKTIGRKPAYANIKSCQYLLIITQRLGGPLNGYQQRQWDKGIFYDPCTEDGLVSSRENIAVECGIFGANFRALAIERGIDTSFTANFKKDSGHPNYDLSDWKKLPFVNRRVNLIMTIGHGKKYRNRPEEFHDPKPNFGTIVKWV